MRIPTATIACVVSTETFLVITVLTFVRATL